jgi:hypothetical protein
VLAASPEKESVLMPPPIKRHEVKLKLNLKALASSLNLPEQESGEIF